jgi:histidinol-phosphatase (PHP family)
MYPSPRMLEHAHALGIPVTFGSDAHHPDRVGQKTAEASELLKTAGIRQLATFESRKRTLISF